MSPFPRRIASFISIAAMAAAAIVGSTGLSSAGATESAKQYLIVVSGDDAVAPVANALRGRGIEVEKEKRGIVDYVRANLTPDEAAAVEALPGVRWIEPNSAVKLGTAQPISSNQFLDNWGLDRIDQRSMPLTGNYLYDDRADGTGVDIYIVDTGIRRTHEEFTGRVATGYYDASFASSTDDDCGHGTHVSGIAAGTRYGVAKKATIVPVKIFPGGSKAICDAGTDADAFVDGLTWIKNNHVAGKPAVVNLSLGTDSNSPLIDAAVRALADPAEGIVVIAAAGNDGDDPAKGYVDAGGTSPSPACSSRKGTKLDGMLTVAAAGGIEGSSFTGEDKEASYSNYGPCVDVFAPGTNIRSAWPVAGLTRPTDANNPDLFDGKYADTGVNNKSGTSMAAPFVSGAAALLLQKTPNATAAEITASIIANATSNTLTLISRGAVASPNKLLYTCASVCPPGAPRNVAISRAARTEINVSWEAPESNGGADVTGYTATATAGVTTVTCTSTTTSCTLKDLTAGTSYAITVAAANVAGNGALSAAQSLTPGVVPTAPGTPTVVVGSGEATVTWTAPTDSGGPAITKYTVTSNPDAKTCSPTAGALSCKFTGLTNGTKYTFTVTATNEIGESPASVASTPAAPALPWEFVPAFASVTAGSGKVSLTWTQAKVRGTAPAGYFTGYVVTDSNGNVVCTTTALKCTVTKLKNGTTLKFKVAATTIADTSQAATSASVVVGGVRQKANGIRKGSRALLSGFATTNSKGKITWRALSGGCRVTGAVLTAPASGKTCKLRISVAKSGVYPAQTVTLTIQIV